MSFFKSKKSLFLTALAVRLAAGWALGHFSHPASWEPEMLADNLLAGKGYLYEEHLGVSYRAFLLPAYPFFCAFVYLLTRHSQLVLLLLQCLLSASACLQIQAIGRMAFPKTAVGPLAGWMTALHPGLIFYATLLHPLTLDLFSYLWTLWACIAFFQNPGRSSAVHLGLASGLALLSRGTILPFLLIALALFLWRTTRGRSWRRTIAPAAAAVLLTAAGVLPWLVRNASWFGRFPLFITSGSQSFWQGNSPLSIGTAHLPDGSPIIEHLPEEMRSALAKTDEIGQADLFRRQALEFIRQNPGKTLNLFFKKWIAFWWFSPSTGLYYPAAATRGYRIYQGLLLALAGLGFWSLRRRRWTFPLFLPVVFLLSVAFFQSLYYVEGRHRWTVEPALLLFSACGLLSLRGESPTRRTARSYSLLWRKAFNRPLGEETLTYHLEEMRESLALPDPKGRILDAGCGEGIDLANQAKKPGVQIIGAELSPGGCWASSQRIRNLPAARMVQADLSVLPFREGTFDFVYSYGVLHHLTSPASGMRELVRVAKPGAWVAVYLYEDFSDRSLAWRGLLLIGNLPRYLTIRMPHRLLYASCWAAAPIAYLSFTLPFKILRRIGLNSLAEQIPFRHASGLWDLTGDLYDRFATPIEHRYSRSSAEALLREGGLRQVRTANRRGWMVSGIKPNGAER